MTSVRADERDDARSRQPHWMRRRRSAPRPCTARRPDGCAVRVSGVICRCQPYHWISRVTARFRFALHEQLPAQRQRAGCPPANRQKHEDHRQRSPSSVAGRSQKFQPRRRHSALLQPTSRTPHTVRTPVRRSRRPVRFECSEPYTAGSNRPPGEAARRRHPREWPDRILRRPGS